MHPSAERWLFTRLRNEAEGATEDTRPVVACPPSSDLLRPRDVTQRIRTASKIFPLNRRRNATLRFRQNPWFNISVLMCLEAEVHDG